MTKHLLFIHGAGEGAYEEDKILANNLQEELGPEYIIHYPMMHDESNAPYTVWKKQVEEEVAALKTPIILVGHSVGASHLAKIFTETKTSTRILGIFLLEAPFWGGEGWRYEGYKEIELDSDANARLPKEAKIFFYHTRDDEVVPFNHLGLYAELVPQATIREIKAGGHQLTSGLSLLVKDIKNTSID
jgi:predicted alpha/beta hydrolase family esterase